MQKLIGNPNAPQGWERFERGIGVLEDVVVEGGVAATFESLSDATVGLEGREEEVF